jgi:pyruvate dehydrogenase E1 component
VVAWRTVTSEPTTTRSTTTRGAGGTAVVAAVERRVLWLATAMVHHANRVRPNPSGLKVGGHQASSASMTTIMTELWFRHLRPQDRVSVKPHASPVLHAINHLLGALPAEYLTTLREFGGLQSYPSRAKDPDPVDYSTGSVGIGATAPIWGALARRYTARFEQTGFGDPGTGRQYSLLGDAELDEGACWEAVLDPMVGELGEVVWIVDLNRQSLDRVVPILGATRLQGMFAAAGWQVLTVKFGHRLQELFTAPAALLCAPGSTTCPTRSTSGCSAAPMPSCANGCPRTTLGCATSSTPSTTPRCAPRCATWAGTTSTRSARPSPRSTTPARQ